MNRYLLLIPFLLFGCARDGGKTRHDVISRSALPAAWYQAPERSDAEPMTAEPSGRADQLVGTTFRSFTEALPSDPIPAGMLLSASSTPGWHLDGMIANFGVGVGGVFGALLADGSAAVKVVWRRPLPTSVASPPQKRRTALSFRSSMTAKDVSRLLEPAVQTAATTGSVKDTAALRRNLNAQGLRFLAITRALEKIPAITGWQVDGFELELWIGAEGQVTPAIGLGAQVGVVFSWAMPSDGVPARKPGGPMAEFTRSLAALLPDRASRSELTAAGFDLEELQIGVVASAGGTIGIAAVAAEATGKIIFKPNDLAADAPAAESLMMPVVASAVSAEQSSYLARAGIDLEPDNSGALVARVPGEKLRGGLAHALRMGSYFARRARESESARWKIATIEAEFTASVGGDLRVATVEAGGQVTLVFNRKGANL